MSDKYKIDPLRNSDRLAECAAQNLLEWLEETGYRSPCLRDDLTDLVNDFKRSRDHNE